jgi:hypothetical protein
MAKKKTTVQELVFLESEKLRFSKTPGGVLSLKIGRKVYPRVHAYRAFPLSNTDTYICIRDAEDKEIGILESFAGLPEDMAALVEEELESRYFTPVVKKVLSLKEEFGYVYWDVDTDAGRSRFTARVGHNSAIQLGDSRIVIVDVDGNRFELEDYTILDPKHQRIVELLL